MLPPKLTSFLHKGECSHLRLSNNADIPSLHRLVEMYQKLYPQSMPSVIRREIPERTPEILSAESLNRFEHLELEETNDEVVSHEPSVKDQTPPRDGKDTGPQPSVTRTRRIVEDSLGNALEILQSLEVSTFASLPVGN